MDRGRWLLFLTLALSAFGTGQVWLVQLSSYRLWAYVGPREFHTYHLAWWHGIWGVILAPALLVFAAAVVMPWWRAPGVPAWEVWLGLALQLALAIGTAAWWGPLMARLEAPGGGLSSDRYALLLSTHWLRVAIVTAYALLALAMLIQTSSAGRAAWLR